MVLLQKAEGGVRFEFPSPSYQPPFREGPTAHGRHLPPIPFSCRLSPLRIYFADELKNVIGPIRNLGQSGLRMYVRTYRSAEKIGEDVNAARQEFKKKDFIRHPTAPLVGGLIRPSPNHYIWKVSDRFD